MASVFYNEAARAIAAGEIDLNADDIRVMLLMTNTTADTENDGIVNIDDFTAVDEMDGANYGAPKELANEAVNKDDANDRAEFDADDLTAGGTGWTALGNGTRAVQGALIYKHVDGSDANDLVICFSEFGSTVNPGGSDFGIQWNAEGIAQLTAG